MVDRISADLEREVNTHDYLTPYVPQQPTNSQKNVFIKRSRDHMKEIRFLIKVHMFAFLIKYFT